MKTLLMNPHTGSIDTKENWLADYERLKSENNLGLWFGYEADEYPVSEEEILAVLEEVEK